MQTKTSLTTIFNCSLERAFKTPMLCNVSKIHTGYGLMPKVTHCTEDKEWAKVGSKKKVFVAKSLTHKGGFGSVDNVLERIENKYWKIEVNDFQAWMLGFTSFVCEWKTTELEKNKIQIDYTYTLHSDVDILYPLNWLFVHLFWNNYMKQVMENVRKLAYDEEVYMYE
jgi:hypothetical protein